MRYSEERTTFSSIKIVLYSVYVPLSAITLFKNNAATRQVKLCFVHAWYTTSLGKQPLQAFKLARGLPFRTEMSSSVYPRGCGRERDVSTCVLRAPILEVQVRTWVGVREMVCAKQRQCVNDISNKKSNICNVCEIESWIYHIYRGGNPREESGGIIDLRCP